MATSSLVFFPSEDNVALAVTDANLNENEREKVMIVAVGVRALKRRYVAPHIFQIF